MVSYTLTVSKCYNGSSITFLIDFEFRTLCLLWASTSSGELCCLVTALVVEYTAYCCDELLFGYSAQSTVLFFVK